MESIKPAWVLAAVDTIMFVFAVGFLVYVASTHIAMVSQVNQDINTKYNVYELKNDDEYVPSMEGVPIASVLYDVAAVPDSVTIMISGYTVTAEDKENLKVYNDATSILQHLSGHEKTKYKRSYTLDVDGNITRISYTVS